MKNIKSFIKKHKAEVIVFSIIIFARLIMLIFMNIAISDDSYDYTGINGFDIFILKLNEWRVPIYPLIIDIFEYIVGEFALPAVCLLQFAVSILSSVYLYKAFRFFSNKKYINLAFVAAYSLNGAIWGWDKTILTESLALSLTVFIIYNLIKYLKFPNIKSATIITCMVTVGALLRPVTAVFIPIIIGFFLLRSIFVKKERKVAVKSFFISSVSAILIICYAIVFYYQFGVFSLSNTYLTQQINAVSIKTDLYKYIENEDIVKIIDREKNIAPVVLGFERNDILAKLKTKSSLQKVTGEINKALIKHPIQYGKYLFRTLFNDEFRSQVIVWTKPGYIGEALLLNSISMLSIPFGCGLIISLFCLGVLLWEILRNRRFDWLYFGLFGFIICIFASSLLGTNSEYARTAIQFLPFCYVAIWAITCRSINFIKSTKNKSILGEVKDEVL